MYFVFGMGMLDFCFGLILTTLGDYYFIYILS